MTDKQVQQETDPAGVLDEKSRKSLPLEQRARLLAERHQTQRRPGRAQWLLKRLRAQEGLFEKAYEYFSGGPAREPVRSYAAEWVLDNFYIIQQALRETRQDMPEGYYHRLPKLEKPEGIPRIYAVAHEIYHTCSGHLQMQLIVQFVQAYQQAAPLTIGEVWALPTMLRIIVMEYLAQALARITQIPIENDAEFFAFSEPLGGIPDETVVANAILSLRMLADEDWKAFFEQVNLVEQTLREDPLAIYASMDFETRDSYRKEVEELALASGSSEVAVAHEAVLLAELAADTHARPRERHVGYYLLEKGKAALEERAHYRPGICARAARLILRHPTPVYVGNIAFLVAGFLLALIFYATVRGVPAIQTIVICALFLVLLSRIAAGIVNWIITHTLPPRILPKLDFRRGAPPEDWTIVVIPALLTDAGEVKELLRQLERHYLANNDPHISFALLGDSADAPQQHMPNDDALIAQAVRGVQELNARHHRPGAKPFYLFNREREWNPSEGAWMGWERKRGNLQQFNRLLLGKQSSYRIQIGDLEILPKIKYVITLDADTILPRDSAKRLIATMSHPLNEPEFDAAGNVTAGYTVLQPRTELKPSSANLSPFTRIFAGDTGFDLYTKAVSDVYQDVFGEGIYIGKGIYHLPAFDRSVEGKLPTNAVLSHDLLEGLHGRVALVTDVIFLEDYPSNYLSYMHRLHRWVRGDWQLLPWLFPGKLFHPDRDMTLVNLSLISRWKILDNLLRSLSAPSLLALLILSWFWLDDSPLGWTLIFILAPAIPVAVALAVQWKQNPSAKTMCMRAARWALAVVFLPFESMVMLDAVFSTIFRLAFSRKNLLRWTTAAHAHRLFGRNKMMALFWQQMFFAPLTAGAVGILLGLTRVSAFPVAAPLLFLWLISPQVAYLLSRPYRKKKMPLTDAQRRRLREIARRTWLFFEQFVGPEDHWLPPDHFQEAPRGLVAHRTSITNIGLMLTSIIAAYDLGYISASDLVSRLRNAFESMDLLERYRGHFLNWYDTRTLEPLPPRYVSTVDSGNLLACLIVLKQALREFPGLGIRSRQRWQGLLDILAILDDSVRSLRSLPPAAIAPVYKYIDHFRTKVEQSLQPTSFQVEALNHLYENERSELERRLMSLIEENASVLESSSVSGIRIWAERLRHHLYDMRRELNLLAPWLEILQNPPAPLIESKDPAVEIFRQIEQTLQQEHTLHQVGTASHQALRHVGRLRDRLSDMNLVESDRQTVKSWLDNLQESLLEAEEQATRLLEDYQDLLLKSEEYVHEMQFGFLFDQQREIFYIGYNVDSEQLDNNRYDLLASEARIASLVAIAKGDVPQSHWLHLSRPIALLDDVRGLMSWAGTMFEYLMPALLVRQYDNSLLEQSSQAAINKQMNYCRRKNVPWGISESGYYRFDVNLNYQYRAFGVPGLGFKRGLSEDLVISPYASMLALPMRPQEVMQNAERLARLQMVGLYGFYEAADYTPSRLILGQGRSIVRSFMSHHQSMILLSTVNYLCNEVMIRRFHSDPVIESIELLLQEQMPHRVPLEELPAEEAVAAPAAPPPITAVPWEAQVQTAFPQAYYLSNGTYGVMLSSAGGGYSSWKDIAITRWRPDTTLDGYGFWVYVQDHDSEQISSVGYQPTATLPHEREVFFYPHKADFRCKIGDIIAHMEVTTPPEEDGEIRRITLTNQSSWPRRLSVTSYAEVVLAPMETDQRHPAFNKMFIESAFQPELNALVFRRRTRSPDELPVHLAHSLVLEPGVGAAGMHESDRRRFAGRGGSLRVPAAILPEGPKLSNTTGATLDPIMALSQEIIVEPHSSARVAFILLIAERRRQALALARRYQEWATIDRAFEMARSQSEIELRQHKLTISDLERFQKLFSLLLYPHSSLRADPATLAANTQGQSSLWPFTISGDYPILLIRIGREEEISLVREILKAHTYWRNRRLKIDLVILNMKETGYSQELHNSLLRLLSQTNNDTWLNQRGGIFLLRADQMGESERILLQTAARVILDGEKGSLSNQIEKLHRAPSYLPIFAPAPPPEAIQAVSPVARPENLQFDNGIGGFSRDGKEYMIYIEPGQRTPLPWINVISNPQFGFLVSEAGSGCSWAENSGENRLTTWNNDPVLDRTGEAIYLRDEETAEVWTPTPLPAGAPSAYLARHGAGYTTFEHRSHILGQTLTLFAAKDAPIKIIHLRLENLSGRTRRITVTYYAEWALGGNRDLMQQYIIPEYHQESYALLARNPYNTDFGERVAFLAALREPFGITTDRAEFLGRMGDYTAPAALRRIGLSGTVIPGVDPCGAIQLHIDLYPNESVDEFFLLGQGVNRNEALALIREFQDSARIESALAEVKKHWDELLGRISIDTPDPAMNLMVNRWLLYQNLSCRLWGRSALYQSSGAYGFRDQLQDVMAPGYSAPEITKNHILRAARHQFEAGDVLHWWHPPSGKGVRTRISDDLLWLPYVTAQYISQTGDIDILREQTPFLRGDPLKPEETERYGQFPATTQAFSLYEHCRRAINKASPVGIHGLPLMEAGDWNDGMNHIGVKGFGESIWLGWFLCAVLHSFVPLCRLMDDEEAASNYLRRLGQLKNALEEYGWDGHWYLRAYHDDGSLVGSSQSVECRIDSIAQSWAVLSQTGDANRARTAMDSVLRHLAQVQEKLVLLFTPPFDKTPHDPGYIKGYPPGIRENGGQYTHAALWVVWAFAMLGDGDRAQMLFRLLNPIYHADSPEGVERYQVEPYVVAADVYSVYPFVGRGGWTWYTGSAGWMYRLGIDAILGLKRRGKTLEVDPCIPKDWPAYGINYRFGNALYCIHVDNPDGVNRGVISVEAEGKLIPEKNIPLKDDGRRHEIIVRMGKE